MLYFNVYLNYVYLRPTDYFAYLLVDFVCSGIWTANSESNKIAFRGANIPLLDL